MYDSGLVAIIIAFVGIVSIAKQLVITVIFFCALSWYHTQAAS